MIQIFIFFLHLYSGGGYTVLELYGQQGSVFGFFFLCVNYTSRKLTLKQTLAICDTVV